MADKLKPCPFCGGKAHDGRREAYSVDSSFDFIGCEDCGCMFEYDEPKWNRRTNSLDNSSRLESIAAWNRRTPDLIPRAAAELAALGCSDELIQSVTGHSTTAMVVKYAGPERQKARAKEAQGRRK